MSEVLTRWLKDKSNKVSFENILDQFRCFAGCETFKDLLILEEPRGMLLKWRDHLNVAPGTINGYVSRVKSFYRHFDVEMGRIPRLRNKILHPHKILTPQELRLMIKYADVRDKALIWVLYSTGARIRSVLGLNVGRVNFRAESPVPIHLYASETKFNVEYDTFLCAEALEALKNYVRWRKRCGEEVAVDSPLFVNKYRRRIHYVGSLRSIKRVGEKAEIHCERGERLGHHSFRAAFHRNLQVAGVNQYIIEKLMGHTIENTMTGRYSIGLTLEDLRQAYIKANWSLEIEEGRVRELETRVDETERALGSEMMTRRQMDKKFADQDEVIKTLQEMVAKLMERR